MKRIPSWSLEKVLDILESRTYNNKKCTIFNLLKKAVFLTALACGNRVSEIAALDVTGALAQDLSHLTLAVKPGFMFKNQKMNRSPPNIRIAALESSPTICPVQAIKTWV